MAHYNGQFVAQIDNGEEEVNVTFDVTFTMSPIIPGRKYMRNGDPGYPDEGGEIEIINVINKSGTIFPDDQEDRLLTWCYKYAEKDDKYARY